MKEAAGSLVHQAAEELQCMFQVRQQMVESLLHFRLYLTFLAI